MSDGERRQKGANPNRDHAEQQMACYWQDSKLKFPLHVPRKELPPVRPELCLDASCLTCNGRG